MLRFPVRCMPACRALLTGCLSLLFCTGSAQAQEVPLKVTLLGFYNLENLFDTIDGPNNDEEFLPGGPRHYTGAVYRDKLEKLATVIAGIGTDLAPDGLAVMGCAEVENAAVMRDLAAHPLLAPRRYRYIHYDSPDERGIDVGLFYNPRYFKPVNSEPLRVDNRNPDGTPRPTRDVLYVYGMLNGEAVHLLVGHWPSRRGGEEASAPYRAQAAAVCRHKIDSVTAINPAARIVVMGDLNDDPVNASVCEVLGCVSDRAALRSGGMYNPWVVMYKDGQGTLAYNDAWNLFDQILLSPAWLDDTPGHYAFHEARIYKQPWMIQRSGRFRGYPKRTYSHNKYIGGYSDHFPTYIVLVKQAD